MAEAGAEVSGIDLPVEPKAKWVLPHRVDSMTFIGKDILVVGFDIYIVFFNLKNNTELVYVANNPTDGDGVDVIAGHKAFVFAFSEKIKNSRIFVITYPKFDKLAELQDKEVNRYKGLCMMECDLVAAFSGFPNYMISVWSWRTQQRLLSLPTNVVRRSQMYMCSRSHMLVCQCWGEGLIVWEVSQCYRRCFMMRRAKEEVTGWAVSEPPYVAISWLNDGQLFAIDAKANLYCLLSDGIGMVGNLEWSEELKGRRKPCMCSFGSGLLIYGPDKYIRALKKAESKWKVTWQYEPFEDVERLVSNSSSDVAAAWTVGGLVYRLHEDAEDKIHVTPMLYKQRQVKKMVMIAPDYNYLVTINNSALLCIYDVYSGVLVGMKQVRGDEVSITASPVESILAVYGRAVTNYGVALYRVEGVQRGEEGEGVEGTEGVVELTLVSRYCLTHQIVDRIVFSDTGRHLQAAAMSAGHLFIFAISEDYQFTLVRYVEVGRGLADCFLMKVGEFMRSFALVLFSDQYLIGERIICINAETGKDNKFAGKMAGPYLRLLPLIGKDTMLAIPHMSRTYHVLKLAGDKGVTVSVKMGPIIDAGHDVKEIDGIFEKHAFVTFGYDGNVILRQPDAPAEYDYKLCVSHRYSGGVWSPCVDEAVHHVGHCAETGAALTRLGLAERMKPRPHLRLHMLDPADNTITIVGDNDKNYLDLVEDKKVREETMDYKKQREEVIRGFESAQVRLVALLEENIAERPLHQLSLSEFNLHMEHKKERYKQAERQREEVRLKLESRIRAQDKVTEWIRKQCWDTMLTPRVKLFAIFSHYQVENYAVLPSQRDKWPELQQVEALRTIEMENDADLFCPWEEAEPSVVEVVSQEEALVGSGGSGGSESGSGGAAVEAGESASETRQPYALAASSAHRVVTPLPYYIPQTRAYSFIHMNWQQQIVKLTVQNLRLWFNKQFDDLMNQKKREVGLVEERNARLRFIVDELNKLSDLRGSFHHLHMQITDPEWRQEEQPHRLIKVDPEECSIEPYISPSQIVIIPPDPGPKDDFRERALIEMMDGVLEKLWHEEIKKPIPMPQCMLDKDPEHFNEDDLRLVFEYEAKVKFRNEERDKYRKMLHAEYAKLSQVLNEGIVKFNQKVKEMWLTKLKIDSVIGQENLSLMRLRRTNLDRVESAERIEKMRDEVVRYNEEIEFLTTEANLIAEESGEVQAAYDALQQKDKQLERSFKNHFADLSPIIVDQCYKFFRKRPKWQQRASMIPVILYELATAVLTGVRPPMLHADVVDYFKGVDQLDLISNMPPVMDEGLWATMCKLRRVKIENEIRMRGVAQELAYCEAAGGVWARALAARRTALARTHHDMHEMREQEQLIARNKTIQLVLPAGQVEIVTTGHIEDYDDAALILREDIEKINDVILKVGDLKLRMMRKQMEFRKGILAKEWEHAQMKMKLRHMEQELYSYKRLKIPKELQSYLKNKELGYTEEQDYLRMEKEMQATKMSVNKVLTECIHQVEELQLKVNTIDAQAEHLEKTISTLNVKVSEKKLHEDPLEPIRIRKIFKKRMETLVQRSNLIREVQNNHTTIVMLQTQLELLRLKTYPTLASFKTL